MFENALSANVTHHLLASLVFSPPVRLRGWVQVLENKISRCHTAIFPPSQLNFPPRFRNIIMQNFEILISMISFDKRSERVLCALCCPFASFWGRNKLFSVISSSFGIPWRTFLILIQKEYETWAAQKDERCSFPWLFGLRHSSEGCFQLLWPLFKPRKALINVLEKPWRLIWTKMKTQTVKKCWDPNFESCFL